MRLIYVSQYHFRIVENKVRTSLPCDTKQRRKFVYDVTWAQVPGGPHKKELLENLDRVPTYVQQLQFTVKNPTVGKAATFTKVDNVIQETKNLMNVISKVVTTCFVCATKVSRGNLLYPTNLLSLNRDMHLNRFPLRLRLPVSDELVLLSKSTLLIEVYYYFKSINFHTRSWFFSSYGHFQSCPFHKMLSIKYSKFYIYR